jgi:hypothetical protein
VLKCLFAVAAIGTAAFGQDITVSKDSIKAYNMIISSVPDEVIFTSHTSTPIHFDSGFVQIVELDTAGYGRPGLQVAWEATSPMSQQFVWSLVGAGQDNYRMVKLAFYPGSTEPLTFSGIGTTSRMFHLQVGYCFQCELYPKYPRYIRGTLRLFFSNGQVIELSLRSADLRTAVRRGVSVPALDKGQSNRGNFRYLANGRRVSAHDQAIYRKIPPAVTYTPAK